MANERSRRVFLTDTFDGNAYKLPSMSSVEKSSYPKSRWMPEYLDEPIDWKGSVATANPITPQNHSMGDVLAWAKEDLAKSLIPLECFEEYGGRVLASGTDFLDVLGYVPKCGGHNAEGWALPFKNPATGKILLGNDGRPYWRVRMRHPALTSKSKGSKYLSKNKSGQHAFILPEVHQFLMDNPEAPVICTEGEKRRGAPPSKGFIPLDWLEITAGKLATPKSSSLNCKPMRWQDEPLLWFGTAMPLIINHFMLLPNNLRPPWHPWDAS